MGGGESVEMESSRQIWSLLNLRAKFEAADVNQTGKLVPDQVLQLLMELWNAESTARTHRPAACFSDKEACAAEMAADKWHCLTSFDKKRQQVSGATKRKPVDFEGFLELQLAEPWSVGIPVELHTSLQARNETQTLTTDAPLNASTAAPIKPTPAAAALGSPLKETLQIDTTTELIQLQPGSKFRMDQSPKPSPVGSDSSPPSSSAKSTKPKTPVQLPVESMPAQVEAPPAEPLSRKAELLRQAQQRVRDKRNSRAANDSGGNEL